MATTNTSVRANVRTALICFAVAANALCAGGVYSFPLISPALVEHLKFTQPQIITIALAGMVGQYPFAALVGKVLDARGPRTCSLIAGVMFATGSGLFSRELSLAPESTSSSDPWVFLRLILYFGMIGLGTVFSFFSTVFAATQTFPHYNGIATGTSMALFGSSPLLLSIIATHQFNDQPSGINVTRFLSFLSLLTGATHLFGAFALPGRVENPIATVANDGVSAVVEDEESSTSPSCDTTPSSSEETETTDERSALLPQSKHKANVKVAIIPEPVQEPQHGSTLDLLSDRYFWILAFIVVVVIGTSEMVMASLASIFLSLPSHPSATSTSTIATQVQLLSIANTASRLIVGPLADLLSPVAAYILSHASSEPTYVYSFPRKQHVSRIAFLAGAIVLLVATFAFLEVFVRSKNMLWVVSLGVGATYGTTFTILPGILSSIWGTANLGRNFGIVSYSPFVGTSIFSYLFAYVAEGHNTSPPGDDHGACRGVECWQLTFAVSIGSLVVCLLGSVVLWRRWQGRV